MITAKFRGRCWRCHRAIHPGDPIDRDGDELGWSHVFCAAGRQQRASGSTVLAKPWPDAMFAALPSPLVPKVYRAVATVLHPDHGGDPDAMKQLNVSYQEWRKAC